MKVKNWVFTESRAGGNSMLPAGGYVCRIVAVEDVPSREYVWIVYDVAEGEYAGRYSGMGAGDAWKHRFTRSYKDSAESMFEDFISRLEESNRGLFSVESWSRGGCIPEQFIGLEIGLVFGEERYTKNNGDDASRTVVSYVTAAQDIRNGDFKVPAPKDRREKVETAPTAAPSAGGSIYDEAIPF